VIELCSVHLIDGVSSHNAFAFYLDSTNLGISALKIKLIKFINQLPMLEVQTIAFYNPYSGFPDLFFQKRQNLQ